LSILTSELLKTALYKFTAYHVGVHRMRSIECGLLLQKS